MILGSYILGIIWDYQNPLNDVRELYNSILIIHQGNPYSPTLFENVLHGMTDASEHCENFPAWSHEASTNPIFLNSLHWVFHGVFGARGPGFNSCPYGPTPAARNHHYHPVDGKKVMAWVFTPRRGKSLSKVCKWLENQPPMFKNFKESMNIYEYLWMIL